jgi:hypothetical protein
MPLINENLALNADLWSSFRRDVTPDRAEGQHGERSSAREVGIVVKPAVVDWDEEIPDSVWRNDINGDEVDIDIVV